MFFLPTHLSVIGLTFLLFCTVPAQAEEPVLSWDKRIVHGTLDNGFRYYLFDSRQESDAPKGLTVANLVVLSGAIDEEEDQLGVAHMVEHMVFHESTDLSDGVRTAFTSMGFKQGRDFNAMTNSENTRYMVNVRDTTPEKLRQVLDIYQQIAFHAEIKASSLEKERLIIQEEWRGKLNHRSRINEEKKALLRVGSLYPERPVIGTQETIKNMPADQLRSFYQDWYAPNNMALVIYAPVDMAELEADIKRTFGSEPKRTLPKRHPKDPVLDSDLKIGQLNDPGSKINRVALLYRFKGESSEGVEARRDGLIDYMTRSLLSDQIRRQRDVLPEHVRVLSSTKGELSPNVTILGFSANVDEGYHRLGLETLIQELERVKRHGFYRQDFQRVSEKVLKIAERNKDAAQSRGTIWAVKMVEAVTSNNTIYDPIESNNQLIRLAKTITLEEVNARLREWLSSPDRIVYTQAIGGKDIAVGSPESVEILWQNVAARSLGALQKEQPVAEKNLPNVTDYGTVDLVSRDVALGLSHWKLANGDQLTLLDPRVLAKHYGMDVTEQLGKSYFSAVSAAGYHVKEGSTWAEQIALQMSNATGVFDWSDEEYEAWKKEHGVWLSAKQQATCLTYRTKVEGESLADALGLYRVNQVTPQIDAQVYDGVMSGLKRQTSIDVVRPIEQFSRLLAQARFAEQSTHLTLADLAPLSLDRLNRVRRKQVALPVHFYLVSALEEDRLIDLVATYLATIPRDRQAGQYQTTEVQQQAGEHVVDVALNTEPKAEYRLYAYQAMPWSPSAALQLIYLGERAEAVLKQRLRSEVQGVYSVRVDLELNKDTQRAELKVQFSSDPARLDDLASMTHSVLADWSKMVTDEWVDDLQGAFNEAEQNRLDYDFIGTLAHRLELSERFYGDGRYLKEMGQLAVSLDKLQLKTFADTLRFADRVTGFYRPKK